MDYNEHIEKAIEYIENNLKNDIDLTKCAKAACYSKYHFLRIFIETVKLSPTDYIRKRRITEIVKKISGGCGNISDAAFEYGFNSKENFIRAFKREHHVLPTEYKSAQNSLKLYEPFSFCNTEFNITPKIVTLDEIILTVYKSDEEYPPNFWNKYNCLKFSKRLTGGAVCEDYGVCTWNFKLNKLDYYIGIKEENALGDTSGTVKINILGGLYAVFDTPKATHFTFINTIHKTWSYINNMWFKNSEYERVSGYEFETYIEQSRVFSEKIYIPIKNKEELI